MPRVKRGVPARHRHNKLLAQAKGYRASRHSLYRKAHDTLRHAMRYAFFHRRERKGDMRKLWIARINAAARAQGMTYSEFMAALKQNGVDVNRKMLSNMAIQDVQAFNSLLASVKPAEARN